VLLLALAVVTGWAVWDYLEARQTAELLAAARAAREPLTLYELRPSGRASVEDAARLYLAAADLVRLDDWRELTTIRDGLEAVRAAWPPRSPTGAELAAARELLEKNRQTLEMLDGAARLEFAGFPPGTEYNYRQDRLVKVGRIAALRAAVSALGDDPDATVSAIVSWLRLSRVFQIDAGAMNIDIPVGDIEATIPATLERLHPSLDALSRLERALGDYEDGTELIRTAMTERAWMIEYYWPRYFGVAAPQVTPTDSNTVGPGLREVLLRPELRRRMNERLQLFASIVSTAKTTGGLQMLARLRGLQASDVKSSFYTATPRQILNVYQSYAARVCERIAIERSARLAIAVDRFRLKHGAMPASWEQVASEAKEPVPFDPLTGSPLRLVVRADSYVVYSVGGDGRDDGGHVDRPPLRAPSSPGSPRHAAADWGVRVRIRDAP
jgi:hypothetical protein